MSIAETTEDDGPRPVLSRRHAGGAESARALLFTVLGELVLPRPRPVWTSAFIDVLGRLGIEEKASRQALMRTSAAGWLTRERHGRRTLWTLSPAAMALLTDGAERIYGFRGMQQEWDGRWLLVLARTPESERRARHLLRTRLAWAGLGSPAPGVWISTHPDRAAEAERDYPMPASARMLRSSSLSTSAAGHRRPWSARHGTWTLSRKVMSASWPSSPARPQRTR